MVGIKYGNKDIKDIRVGVEEDVPAVTTFNYTGSDQDYTAAITGDYTIEAYGAGSNTAKGGYAKGTVSLTQGTALKVMVGQNGGSTSGTTYGFGGSSNYSSDRAGGGLSGVFTGSGAITATSSSRAIVIGGGAGGGNTSSSRNGGAGGGETGGTGGGSSYGTAGGGGTQTGRGSGGNVGANQFNGGNGSGTYGWGGGGGWWGGNSSIGDSSGDDDKGAGGGSGYVISTATNRTLTQGGGSAINTHGKVVITGPVGAKRIVAKPIKQVYYGSKKVRPGDISPVDVDMSKYSLLTTVTLSSSYGHPTAINFSTDGKYLEVLTDSTSYGGRLLTLTDNWTLGGGYSQSSITRNDATRWCRGVVKDKTGTKMIKGEYSGSSTSGLGLYSVSGVSNGLISKGSSVTWVAYGGSNRGGDAMCGTSDGKHFYYKSGEYNSSAMVTIGYLYHIKFNNSFDATGYTSTKSGSNPAFNIAYITDDGQYAFNIYTSGKIEKLKLAIKYDITTYSSSKKPTVAGTLTAINNIRGMTFAPNGNIIVCTSDYKVAEYQYNG